MADGGQVCIIGAGMLGLLAAKNLLEKGLEVSIYTKDGYVGGLWHYSDDPEKTTALPSTSANTSKHIVSSEHCKFVVLG